MSGQLQEQIKQQQPFRSLEAEVFLNVLRTSTWMIGELTDLLRPYDLTQPQYNVLRILRGAGAAGLASGEVGARMVSREPDVTRLLARMARRGLVERVRDQADRRVVQTRLTAQGLQLVDALDEPVQAMHVRQLGHLSARDLRALVGLLEQARAEVTTRPEGESAA